MKVASIPAVRTITCGVPKISYGPRVFLAIFVFVPDTFSLFSWLFGDILSSVPLWPADDIEFAIFWISGMTLSAIAVVIALFIWLSIMDIIESISWDSLILNSFGRASKDCLTSFCLTESFSYVKLPYSFLWYVFVIASSWTDDCFIASTNSLSMELLLSFPSITSNLSKSDIMSIFLAFLAFAFCFPVDGIKNCYKIKM